MRAPRDTIRAILGLGGQLWVEDDSVRVRPARAGLPQSLQNALELHKAEVYRPLIVSHGAGTSGGDHRQDLGLGSDLMSPTSLWHSSRLLAEDVPCPSI